MSQLHPAQPKSLQQSIQTAVTADLREAKHLLTLLQDEQAAMESRNSNALAAIVEAKTDCMKRIEQQARTRYQLLQSLQRPADEANWKALVEEQDTAAIHTSWQALLDTLAQCRHNNEVNGRMIGRGQQTLQHLLSIIRGQIDPPSLYNQRGATEPCQNGRSFTQV